MNWGWVPATFKGECVLLKWTRDDCAGNPQMKSGYVLAKRQVPAAAAARRRTRQIRRLLRLFLTSSGAALMITCTPWRRTSRRSRGRACPWTNNSCEDGRAGREAAFY